VMSGAAATPPAGRPDLSIVICSRNGAALLGSTLTSLASQTISAHRYEVIVVDDGSTDDTAAIADRQGARVVGLTPSRGLAAARNTGVRAARGAIVAFTDDDCIVSPAWAETLLQAFAASDVLAVGGRVVPESQSGFVRRFLTANNPLTPLSAQLLESAGLGFRLRLYLARMLTGDGAPGVGRDLYSVVGANMAFRRELLFELDGFDEAFRFGSEEEDLCLRAHGRPGGAHITYAQDAVVHHWFRPSLGDGIRRSRAYGRGNARRYLKHRHTRLIVYPAPVLVATVAAVSLARRRPRALPLAAVAPLLLYPRWWSQAFRRRSWEPLTYPYLLLAQEAAGMLGELDGLRAGYKPAPSRHLTSDASGDTPEQIPSGTPAGHEVPVDGSRLANEIQRVGSLPQDTLPPGSGQTGE
jgi:glycosyltransferase involved in cell wall biosynthesis